MIGQQDAVCRTIELIVPQAFADLRDGALSHFLDGDCRRQIEAGIMPWETWDASNCSAHQAGSSRTSRAVWVRAIRPKTSRRSSRYRFPTAVYSFGMSDATTWSVMRIRSCSSLAASSFG